LIGSILAVAAIVVASFFGTLRIVDTFALLGHGIAGNGRSRFSHSAAAIVFSPSDNSDPSLNGRNTSPGSE
jgi:hypothetical protein